jgi:glycosyltransferase involved in cell wall biosynthesis
LRILQEEFPDEVEVRFNENPLELDTSSGMLPPKESLTDMNWADIIMVSNILKFGGPYTARTCGIAKELGKFLHFDTDDLLTDLYDSHKLFDVYKEQKLDEITKACYNAADLVTVTQKKFAERIQPYISKYMTVFRNTLDYKLPCWNAPKTVTKYARIGWAGGVHHKPDVKVFESVPHLVNQKVGRENLQWNFYGHPPPNQDKTTWEADVWPEYRQRLLKSFKGQPNYNIHYALPPDQYGVYYANMDMAIAPLEMNNFNDSKSDIKAAECSRYKIPLIASNVGCYNEVIRNGQTGYLIDPDAPKTEWIRILSKLVKDKQHRLEIGQRLHDETKDLYDARKQAPIRLQIYREVAQMLNHKFE